MDDLVDRLVKNKKNPIIFEPRTSDVDELKMRLENGFVLVKFTNTAGGTELGLTLDTSLTNSNEADLDKLTGQLSLSGMCELNSYRVRCIVKVNLETMHGEGYLELVD